MILIPDSSIVGEEGVKVDTFINVRLKEVVEEAFEAIADSKVTIFEAWVKLEDYFPYNFPKSKMKGIVRKLLEKLESEEEITLTLVEEYVLAKVLDRKIKACEEEGVSTIKKMENRGGILCAMVDKNLAENEKEADEILCMVEDLKNYGSICFEDWDYAFFDCMPEEQLNEKFWENWYI